LRSPRNRWIKIGDLPECEGYTLVEREGGQKSMGRVKGSRGSGQKRNSQGTRENRRKRQHAWTERVALLHVSRKGTREGVEKETWRKESSIGCREEDRKVETWGCRQFGTLGGTWQKDRPNAASRRAYGGEERWGPAKGGMRKNVGRERSEKKEVADTAWERRW